MSDFHLKTELEGDPDENKQRMAAAFETGLRHCATDPLVRLKMILGEAYSVYPTAIAELVAKLAKENDDVRELAVKVEGDPDALVSRDPHVADIQAGMLSAALKRLRHLKVIP